MWSAIQGDLMDFVSTIKQDVESAMEEISTEINGTESQGVPTERTGSGQQKNQSLIDDIGSSRTTFTEEVHHHEYAQFRESFMIDDHAAEIARLLLTSGNSSRAVMGADDISYSVPEENSSANENIAAFYAEMVPRTLSREEFWARYFFRVAKLTKSISTSSLPQTAAVAAVTEEEDDGENLAWDDGLVINSDSDAPQGSETATTPGPSSGTGAASGSLLFSSAQTADSSLLEENDMLRKENNSLREENNSLKVLVRELQDRVDEMTRELEHTTVGVVNSERGVCGEVGENSVELTDGSQRNANKTDTVRSGGSRSAGLEFECVDEMSSSTASLDSSVEGLVLVSGAKQQQLQSQKVGDPMLPLHSSHAAAQVLSSNQGENVNSGSAIAMNSSFEEDEEEEGWD